MAPPPKPWTAEKAKEKGFSSITSFTTQGSCWFEKKDCRHRWSTGEETTKKAHELVETRKQKDIGESC
jgi:hypothetical protein